MLMLLGRVFLLHTAEVKPELQNARQVGVSMTSTSHWHIGMTGFTEIGHA